MYDGKVEAGTKIGRLYIAHLYPLQFRRTPCYNVKRRHFTYRHNWFRQVHQMEDDRLPKQVLDYHPKGRQWPGRPLKKLLDDVNAETEKGHSGLNS
jgi:hypothetical protein